MIRRIFHSQLHHSVLHSMEKPMIAEDWLMIAFPVAEAWHFHSILVSVRREFHLIRLNKETKLTISSPLSPSPLGKDGIGPPTWKNNSKDGWSASCLWNRISSGWQNIFSGKKQKALHLCIAEEFALLNWCTNYNGSPVHYKNKITWNKLKEIKKFFNYI